MGEVADQRLGAPDLGLRDSDLVRRLAERLVRAELLDRAASLLEGLLPQLSQPQKARLGAQLAEIVAKGAGGTLFLETDDCQAAYDELSARGVEFNDPPTPQPYGIDTSFRDPSGNNIRLTQVLEFSLDRR